MLPFVLFAIAAALLAGAVLVARRRGGTMDALAAPETTPAIVPQVEPPRARDVVLSEAIPAAATISGPVAPPPSSTHTLETLDALLAELESATVRIDGADALDQGSVAELEELATRLEAAAEALAAR